MRALRRLNQRWILFEDSDTGRRLTGLMTPLTIGLSFLILGTVGFWYHQQLNQQVTDLRTLLVEQKRANDAQQKSINELLDAAAAASPSTEAMAEPVPHTPTP